MCVRARLLKSLIGAARDCRIWFAVVIRLVLEDLTPCKPPFDASMPVHAYQLFSQVLTSAVRGGGNCRRLVLASCSAVVRSLQCVRACVSWRKVDLVIDLL